MKSGVANYPVQCGLTVASYLRFWPPSFVPYSGVGGEGGDGPELAVDQVDLVRRRDAQRGISPRVNSPRCAAASRSAGLIAHIRSSRSDAGRRSACVCVDGERQPRSSSILAHGGSAAVGQAPFGVLAGTMSPAANGGSAVSALRRAGLTGGPCPSDGHPAHLPRGEGSGLTLGCGSACGTGISFILADHEPGRRRRSGSWTGRSVPSLIEDPEQETAA